MESLYSELETQGYSVIHPVFSKEEQTQISDGIAYYISGCSSVQENTVYGIRMVLTKVPGLKKMIFTEAFSKLVGNILGKDYTLIKSVYFDKPAGANWTVPYHQDISVNFKVKAEIAGGYYNWLRKGEFWSVNAPDELLNRIYTFRIHLDDANETNGALKVIAGSHLYGTTRLLPEGLSPSSERVVTVKAGGVMLVRPLLWHASLKSEGKRRRVIHLEFYKGSEPEMPWAECIPGKN